MITLLFLLVLAVIFTLLCIVVDIAWPVLLALMVLISIDVAFFKAIFGKKRKERKNETYIDK